MIRAVAISTLVWWSSLGGCATVEPVPTSRATCETYCANAAKRGCDFAAPTPKGVSCIEVCQNAQGLESWDLACMSDAESCEDIGRCSPGR